jgi:hypothetical protein
MTRPRHHIPHRTLVLCVGAFALLVAMAWWRVRSNPLRREYRQVLSEMKVLDVYEDYQRLLSDMRALTPTDLAQTRVSAFLSRMRYGAPRYRLVSLSELESHESRLLSSGVLVRTNIGQVPDLSNFYRSALTNGALVGARSDWDDVEYFRYFRSVDPEDTNTLTLIVLKHRLAAWLTAIDMHRGTSKPPNTSGAANGSQPIRSETNRTSSAAGSRR